MSAQFFAASQFSRAVFQISPLGNGLINDTFLVTTSSAPFVLQRINRQVFPKPEHIMDNLITLHRHIGQQTDVVSQLQFPDLLKTVNNESYFLDKDGDCWRALSFIENTESLESVGKISDAGQTGFALGHFHRLTSNLDPKALQDTLPGFHITPGYLSRYLQLSKPSASSSESRYCAEFIARFQHLADCLETAKDQGLLALRVIHGDPKLNNFLFDRQTGQLVSLIDLDTVKPGLVHYDIGDCLRSCCHHLETDNFDLAICAALLTSYLSEAGAFFSHYDYHFLYPATLLIPFELGLRFYTDYLEGNCYFKVSEPLQNLQRACSQFQLCESIMAQEKTIKILIEQLTNKSLK